MSIDTFNVGMSINKMDQLFTSIGLINPTRTKLYENYQKLKSHIIDLSKI